MIEQTREVPASPDLSNTDNTLEESVNALTLELEQNPENAAAARLAIYETMQQMLRKDAFLAYQNETKEHYTVSTIADIPFVHPKDRAMPDVFPRLEQPPSQEAINWLGWSLVGLIPAGLGTLVCGPVAIFVAIKLLIQKNAISSDRRRAWVVLGTAIVLWLIALVILMILILHLV
jgi:hypothetical protein